MPLSSTNIIGVEWLYSYLAMQIQPLAVRSLLWCGFETMKLNLEWYKNRNAILFGDVERQSK